MKRSLHSLHKDYDFGSGMAADLPQKHTQSIMEILPRKKKLQGSTKIKILKKRWDGMDKLISITQK